MFSNLALSSSIQASGFLKDSTIGSNPINLVITKMQIHTTPQVGKMRGKEVSGKEGRREGGKEGRREGGKKRRKKGGRERYT